MQKGTKKFILLIIAVLLFSICSFTIEVQLGDKLLVAEEGIRPAQLSEHDKELLHKFGLDSNNMALFSFTAPKEAESMMIDTFILRDGEWILLSPCGGISLGGDRDEYERLYGEFAILSTTERESRTMLIAERELEFRMLIGTGTLGVTYSNLDTGITGEYLAQGIAFLDEEREIELGERIPVALLLYNRESRMPVVSMEHYDAPDDRFDMVDEVIAVTVTFTE